MSRFLPVLFLLFSWCLGAQNEKVTSGVVSYQNQDYATAVDLLSEALAQADQLAEKNVPKAHYYRAKARYAGFYREGKGPNAGRWENTPLLCYEDLQAVLGTNDEKWTSKAEAELAVLRNALLAVGLDALNASADQTGTDRQQSLQEAQAHLEAALEIEADHMVYDLLGQTSLSRGDSTRALSLFYQSIDAFAQQPPNQPDQLVGYTFYRAALIERMQHNDLDKALDVIKRGKQALEQEHLRAEASRDSYTTSQWAQIEQQYQFAMEDLSRFELDVLLNAPEKSEEALAQFAKAVEQDPDNYTLLMAYANLVEKTDVQRAIELYDRAIQVNPDNSAAYFNAGALQINQAVPLLQEANESTDMTQAMELQNQALDYYRSARPYFEKAHQTDPTNLQVLQALQQICISLGDTDGYQKYKAAADDLRN